MRKLKMIVALLLLGSLSLSAGKMKGTTTLKDLQAANTPDKNNKKQMYDFLFVNGGNSYTCRTDRDAKVKATDFVVGDSFSFEVDGDKAKLKNASGKQVKCTVIRVEKVTAAGN